MTNSPTFIETQFPIAKLSAESYKERKAVSGQTLTGLGKWWGRKPLILVRASILGMLMPASSNPKKDREIYLKILTMDNAGVWDRCKPTVQRKTSRTAFDLLPYAERIAEGERPENITGPSEAAWVEINAHLGTQATSLPELVEQLGKRQFGHTPRVGDSFCGGGSIPFEAARIGCEAFGSDLNPVAGLLTWANLNLLGGGTDVQDEVCKVQKAVFAAADQQITEWGIEHNERGERADAYLYCVEVKPEGCDYYIPLAPSWIVDEYCKTIVSWHKVDGSDRLAPEVTSYSANEFTHHKDKNSATVIDSRVIDPFDASRSWSIEALRGPEGLRRWSNDDVVPRPGDMFQERLYCIRWINAKGERRYAAPGAADLAREAKVLELLRERFAQWQQEGFTPSKAIPEDGDETARLYRERGWTHWHHLFTPRQLLVHGLLANIAIKYKSQHLLVATMLNIGRISGWNSRLSQWLSSKTQIAGGKNTFSNQALNTLFNYSTRPIRMLESAQVVLSKPFFRNVNSRIAVVDARDIRETCDFWITDPPYADAVNYHELGDFFLAWYDKQLAKAFPDWIPDARAELAVRGDGDDFRRSMVDIYQNLTAHMPDNGLQLVMFTHQDPSVWADLGMILWAAGLKVSAAWTIATETPAAGIKKGNYVQGTVLLVLRKRIAAGNAFLDELYPLVEDEVKHQIDSMRSLDDASDPNFGDTDYQLAAYAAALRILTQYQSIDGQDVSYELFRAKPGKGRGRAKAGSATSEKSRFEQVIDRAISIACDYLVPKGLEEVWMRLVADERLYLRSLDVEGRGERRQGVYQELARGFGVREVKPILASTTANQTRIKTASEFGNRDLGPLGAEGFGGTVLRQLLFAVHASRQEENPGVGLRYLKDELVDYWQLRQRLISILDWISPLALAEDMEDWKEDGEYARLLAGLLRGDHG
jgi:adenine-specific DNA methylase